MTRYVIVGAGVAGTTAAEEIRKRDPEAEITLIGEEEHALYSRVLLPHYLKGKVPKEKCFLKKETWYDEHRIEYLRGERVTEIDTKNKHVVLLTTLREVPYDKLLITTGGEPRSIDAHPRGVGYLQTIDDAEQWLQVFAEQAGTEPRQAVVYGGGFIACEFLNLFHEKGYASTCVFRGPWFWSRVLDEESGAFIMRRVKEMGVRVISEAVLDDTVGEKDVEGVVVNGEQIPASVVGVGVGLERDLRLVAEAGVLVREGVLANAYLETSAEDVYAAGDVAEVEDVVTGCQAINGNWMSALLQGRHAGRVMTGEREVFRLVSSYSTQVFGLEIVFIGHTKREWADKIVVRKPESGDGVTQVFLKAGKVIGATMVGNVKERMGITKLIEQQVDFDGKEELLENGAVSLATFLGS